MAFDFPASPTEGQSFSPAGGPTYVYSGGVWKLSGSVGPNYVVGVGTTKITVATTAPVSPLAGDLWVDTT